jgi:hypothetical protein
MNISQPPKRVYNRRSGTLFVVVPPASKEKKISLCPKNGKKEAKKATLFPVVAIWL